MTLPLHILVSLKNLLLNRYTLFLLFLFGYTRVMELYGGLPSLQPAWRLEIPLLLFLYFFGNMITRKSPMQAVIVAVPIVLCYAVFDFYNIQLGRLPRLIELTELPELLAVMPLWLKSMLIALYGISLLSFLRAVRWGAVMPMTLGLMPLAGLAVAVEAYPDAFMAAFVKTQKEIVFYSDVKSVANNGRLSMTLYNEARRKSMLEKTAHYRDNPFYLLDMDKVVSKIKGQQARRNVHLIVLESFLDPELLLAANFSRKPAHPEFEKIFKHKGGLSVSPVFGGSTAQAEFELLCGVPAMRELSGVEFNVFTGAKTPCLPNLLGEGGYHAIATNGHRPDFFNSTNAYEGIGFANAYYPSEYAPGRETYFSQGDVSVEDYMFDGDLLSQNLTFVEAWLKEHPQAPLFNYVITMYGHTPNVINTEKRPEVVQVSGNAPADEQLQRAVNQYYYRTEAIAAFVKELVRIDPKSLIILVSDHLPPLVNGPNTYRDYNYLGKMEGYLNLNRIFFVENGRSVQYNTIHHYDVPEIILGYVTHGKKDWKSVGAFAAQKGPVDFAAYRRAYMTIMAQAMRVKKLLPASRHVPAAADDAAAQTETVKVSPPQDNERKGRI
jgi:phosphoglycerol transferase MdoB-like AlkP superfamily enzyme